MRSMRHPDFSASCRNTSPSLTPHLDDFPLHVPLDELLRRTLCEDAALIHDDQFIAQALGLLHVVRGQQQGLAARLEFAQSAPDQVARLRVQSGGRFVQRRELRVIDQGARDGQAPPHAAGEGIGLCRAPVGQRDEFQQAFDARGDLPARQAEVGRIDVQILLDREVGIEIISRGTMPTRARIAGALRATGRPNTESVPPLGGVSPIVMRSVVVLPAPLGPTKPKHRPG